MKASAVIAVTLSVVAIAAVWAAGGNTLETYESNDPVWTRPVTVANFPNPQNVAGTVDVGNLPAVQTVDGAVDVGNLPTDADGAVRVSVQNWSGAGVFRFVGVTAQSFTGGAGWVGLTRACYQEYPGARIAFLDEYLLTVNPPDIPPGVTAWIARELPRDGSTETGACNGEGGSGTVVTAGGNPGGAVCTQYHPVACAAPVE